MKKQILVSIATLSIIFTLAITGLANLKNSVTVDIPFAFTVQGKTLPAGEYVIAPGRIEGTVVITNKKTGEFTLSTAMHVSGKTDNSARLIFRRYGQQAFLAEVYDGTDGGQSLPKSSAERAIANGKGDFLARNAEPEIVTLGAEVTR